MKNFFLNKFFIAFLIIAAIATGLYFLPTLIPFYIFMGLVGVGLFGLGVYNMIKE